MGRERGHVLGYLGLCRKKPSRESEMLKKRKTKLKLQNKRIIAGQEKNHLFKPFLRNLL
jgi:hypothetical protein